MADSIMADLPGDDSGSSLSPVPEPLVPPSEPLVPPSEPSVPSSESPTPPDFDNMLAGSKMFAAGSKMVTTELRRVAKTQRQLATQEYLLANTLAFAPIYFCIDPWCCFTRHPKRLRARPSRSTQREHAYLHGCPALPSPFCHLHPWPLEKAATVLQAGPLPPAPVRRLARLAQMPQSNVPIPLAGEVTARLECKFPWPCKIFTQKCNVLTICYGRMRFSTGLPERLELRSGSDSQSRNHTPGDGRRRRRLRGRRLRGRHRRRVI